MIDVHSHILPGMDDGCKDAEESIAVLKKLAEQKVDTVHATSHFYANREKLDHFLQRRELAGQRLAAAMEAMEEPLPEVVLGAEVWYFDGISRSDSLRPLCTDGTNILLLEMPFCGWTDRMLGEIVSLKEEGGFSVLLAHIERYLRWQKRGALDWLSQHDILMQANAEAFLERKTARKVLKMLEQHQVQLLGTDCHNLTSRPPNYGDAIQKIRESLGDDALEYLREMERLFYPSMEAVH